MDAKDVVASLSPFGGGLGSSGGVCGALPGALAVIGLLMGKREPEGRDHKLMWRLAYKLVKGFEEITREYGGIECRDIARVDWKDPSQVKAYYKGVKSRRMECMKVIGATADLLGRLLHENEVLSIVNKDHPEREEWNVH